MNKTISRKQITLLETYQKSRDEDNGQMTMYDKLLDLFMPVKVGIKKNGLTAPEIAEAFEAYTYQELAYIRTALCQFQSKLVEDGFPFGGIRDGRLKRYGFPSEREFMEIERGRKERLKSEVLASKKYLDREDPLLAMCNKLITQCDNQLKLFYNE